MDFTIRPAEAGDAEQISQVVISALRETNAKDYSEADVTRVAESFTPVAVSAFLADRLVFVAAYRDQIVGTAGLDGSVVRTVFIEPRFQGCGIGRALMAEVERAAIERGIETLLVPSSITAQQFYTKIGFSPVRDSYDGEERIILMERRLSRRSNQVG